MHTSKSVKSAVRFCYSGRGLSVLTAVIALSTYAGSARAIQFNLGDVSGSADTTLSYGTLFRVGKPDQSLIGIANGGTSRSVNEDNGDLNYERGHVVNSLLGLDESLELKYQNFAFFARGNYFYDTQVAGNDLQKFGPEGQERLKDRATLLDLFVSGNFNLDNHDINVRVGNQVINWGESTFIQGGLNVANSVDLSKLRQPGSQLKNALLPTPALSVSADLTTNLSFAGYALARQDPIILDPDGAYFSTNDIASDDGTRAYLSFGRGGDGHMGTLDNYVTRTGDHREDGFGQFGVSLHYVSPALNYSEFGLYFERYDSHIPLLSVTAQQGAAPGTGAFAGAAPGVVIPGVADGSAHYFAEYPKNIRVFGVSFSSALPYGIAVQGEYTYRPNLPVQLPGADLIQASLQVPSEINPTPAAVGGTNLPAGSYIQGYRSVGAHQLQFTLTKSLGQSQSILGADQTILLGEFGADYLDLPDNLKFAGPGADLPVPPTFYGDPAAFYEGAASAAYFGETNRGSVQNGGFATKFSWGYVLLAQLNYLDAFNGVNVSPSITFSDDVTGVGPEFTQGNKAATVGVNFSYLSSWNASMSYTTFFGGRRFDGTDPIATPGQSSFYSTNSNSLNDRDFVAASVSYSF